MRFRLRVAILLFGCAAAAATSAGGLLGRTLEYYTPPADPDEHYSRISVRTNIENPLEFGIILFSDPVDCKGQVVVKRELASPATLVYAEKIKPFTLSANYLVWEGHKKTTCNVIATLLPVADKYEYVFDIDPEQGRCRVTISQADGADEPARVPDDLIAYRGSALPFAQSGMFCTPMDEKTKTRLKMD